MRAQPVVGFAELDQDTIQEALALEASPQSNSSRSYLVAGLVKRLGYCGAHRRRGATKARSAWYLKAAGTAKVSTLST